MTSISRARSTESATSDSATWPTLSRPAGRAAAVFPAADDVAASDVCAVLSPETAAMCASRARARLSVRACTRATCAWAAAAALASTTSPPQAATDTRLRSATPNHALRATGLPLPVGRLDERADLELGLEQRAAGVVHRLGGVGIGRRDREIVRDDDPLQAGDVGHELADLVVVPDDGHVVLVGIEWCRPGLHRERHHLRQRHAADLAAGGDVIEQVGHLVALGHQPTEQREAPAVRVEPLAKVVHGAARQLPLGAVR